MNNTDMSKLLSMLSKMDKKDLEKGLAQAEKLLSTEDKNNLLNKLKGM